MTRRKTDGERISMWVLQYELDNHFSSVVRPSGGRKEISLAERIDHLIRKRMAKAWDEGKDCCFRYTGLSINPYRGRKRK